MYKRQGYVSEKILDCLVSGIVPIYAGADDIADYVPEDCFIPYNRFKNPEEMMGYLKKIDKKQYQEYLDAIQNFLNSDKTKVFDGEEYAKNVYYLIEHAKMNTFRVDGSHRFFLNFCIIKQKASEKIKKCIKNIRNH